MEECMCCKRNNLMMALGGMIGLLALGAAVWYLLQPEWRKEQLKSLARQTPEIPGRYMD
jgi:hypothetical protein